MALIKLGSIVTDIRGAIAGVVFTRNGSGAIARARVKPVNPNTPLQSAARAIFSAIVALWNHGGLTEDQREAWRTYAKNVGWINRLGETITLSGMNMFVRTNISRQNADIAIVDDGPVDFTLVGADDIMQVAIDETNQEISVTFDDTRDWVDEDDAGMAVLMGSPQNAGTNSFDGPWRYAGVILGDSVAAPTTPTTIPVPFPVVEGQKVTVKAYIMRADGRQSTPFRDSTSVIA
jgi:hypothetical protein